MQRQIQRASLPHCHIATLQHCQWPSYHSAHLRPAQLLASGATASIAFNAQHLFKFATKRTAEEKDEA